MLEVDRKKLVMKQSGCLVCLSLAWSRQRIRRGGVVESPEKP